MSRSILLLLLLLDLFRISKGQTKTPTIQNLISNSKGCVNVSNQGSGNNITVNVNDLNSELKKIYQLIKASSKNNEVYLKKLDQKIENLNQLVSSKILITTQVEVTKELDSLSDIYLTKSNFVESKNTLLKVFAQTTELKCISNLKLIEINGKKYYVGDKQDMNEQEITIFETSNESNRILFKFRNKFGYVDSSGNIIIPAKYDTAFAFSESLAYVKQNLVGEWFINKEDSIVIDISEMHFSNVYPFKDSVALVRFKDDSTDLLQLRYNYINKRGNLISAKNFIYASPFSYGLGCVQYFRNSRLDMGPYTNLDFTDLDKVSVSSIDSIYKPKFSNFSLLKRKKIFSLISKYRKLILYTKYGSTTLYGSDSRKLKISDTNNSSRPKTIDELFIFFEKEVGPNYKINDTDTTEISLYDSPKPIFVSKPFIYDKPFHLPSEISLITGPVKKHITELTFLNRSNLCWGYIDARGNLLVRTGYYFAEPFDFYNTARVIKDDASQLNNLKAFLINRNGDIKGKGYLQISTFQGFNISHPWKPFTGKFTFSDKTLIDTSGKMYFNSDSLKIIEYRNGFIITSNFESKIGITTIYGLQVIPNKFKAISFIEDNIIGAQDYNNEIIYFLIDVNGSALKLEKKE